MASEYCHRCGALTNMNVSQVEREEKGDEGENYRVITKSYHCSRCQNFVRSEDIKELLDHREV